MVRAITIVTTLASVEMSLDTARTSATSGKSRWIAIIFFVYAALTFIYFYRTNGGTLPNLWVRVMTAWITMLAVVKLTRG
jgi:hypothetical protein